MKENLTYLLTTAITPELEAIWPKNTKLLLLGSWALRPSQKHKFVDKVIEVEPYHWGDEESIYADYFYLDKIYETNLRILSDQLNRLHGTDHSIKYWRIVIGPWLAAFVKVLYDRWVMINRVNTDPRNLTTTVIDFPSDKMIPDDLAQFRQEFMLEDNWNHYIYGEILKFINFEDIKYIGYEEKKLKQEENHASLNIRSIIKNKMASLLSIFNTRNKYLFYFSGINLLDQWKLQISLGDMPSMYEKQKKIDFSRANLDLRRKMVKPQTNVTFESFLSQIIPQQIPRSAIEDYFHIEKASDDLKFPMNIKAIITASALYADDIFSFWCAQKVENGTKLIVSQHGGGYGTWKYNDFENHELAISDSYFSWGWKKETYKNIIPLPSGKLVSSKRMKHSKKGDLLLVETTSPRYSHSLAGKPDSSRYLTFEQDQFDFIKSLGKNTRGQLRIRFKAEQYGWDQEQSFRETLGDCKFDSFNTSFSESIAQSRLCVVSNNITSYLETFSANIPTIIFWNPKLFPIREEAKPLFKKLSDAEILFYDSEEAAEKVNLIWSDVEGWWQGQEVQCAIDEFVYSFARVDDDWKKSWKNALLKLI